MILPDANLLIYATDRDSPRHNPARRWLEDLLSAAEPVGFSWVVLLAFVRITTRHGILKRPLATGRAIDYVDSWLEQPGVSVVVPGPHHWRILRSLLVASGTAGNLTSDAHLAALAIERGAAIHSADYDFRRFAGIRHVNPLGSD